MATIRTLGFLGLVGLTACASAPSPAPPNGPAAPPAAANPEAGSAGRAATSSLKTNTAGVALIKQSEALRLETYELGGLEFIGYGHLQKQGEPDRITEAEADALLRADLHVCEAAIGRAVSAAVSSNEFSAMASLCYNIGTGNFASSSVVKQINAGNRSAAADAFLLWNKADGAVLDHLAARRKQERDLFLKP